MLPYTFCIEIPQNLEAEIQNSDMCGDDDDLEENHYNNLTKY